MAGQELTAGSALLNVGWKTVRGSRVQLPDVDSLTGFFDQLRATQYRLDPQQLAVAYRILLSAHADNWTVDRLQFVLMILLAKTRQEQRDFVGHFDRWLGIRRPSERRGLAVSIARRSSPILIWMLVALGAFIIVALGAFIIYWAISTGGPSNGIPTKPSVGQLPSAIAMAVEVIRSFGLAKVIRAGALIPLAVFVSWILLRWHRRALWLEARATGGTIDFDQIEVPAALGHVFGGPDLYATARELRRHRPVPWLDLDIDRTVESTARQAGHFSAVWRQRVRRPEYVVLIEENGRRDHIARILDAGLEALKKLGVWIQRYYYSSDPRVVVRDDPNRTPVNLAALGERGRHTRLIIFGSGRGLVNPLTDRVGSRIRQALQPWTERVFLSTEPMETWAEREHQLLRDGFSVGTASVTGLLAVATRVAQGSSHSGELLEGRLKISQREPVSTSPTASLSPSQSTAAPIDPMRERDAKARWELLTRKGIHIPTAAVTSLRRGIASGLGAIEAALLTLARSAIQFVSPVGRWIRDAAGRLRGVLIYVAVYVLFPAALLVAAHVLVTIVLDVTPLSLRLASMVIPLLFGLVIYAREEVGIRGTLLFGTLTATIAIVCMLTVTGLHDRVPIVPDQWIEWREVLEYAASIALAYVTGNIFGFMVFPASPMVMSHGGEPSTVAYNIARVLGQHVGDEELRRRARIIQDRLLPVGTLIGIVATAGGSIYTGLKGIWGW
jgi:hypothetical protein